MIDYENETGYPFDVSRLEPIATALSAGDMEFILTDDAAIRELNREHRGIDKATDVLSFPYEPMPMSPVGSIVVSYEHAKEVAQALGHSVDEEITLLFVHGLLHLLGYDHECDKGEMREKEYAVIEAFNLPKSLIIRTEEH